MPISFSCACGKELRARDELAGRKTKCPACSEILTIPKPEPEAPADDPEDFAYALMGQDPGPRPVDRAIPPAGPSEAPPRLGPSTFSPVRDTPAASNRPTTRALPPEAPKSGSLLEYAYLLLFFALVPLSISLLTKDREFKDRLQATLEKATPEEQARIVAVLTKENGSMDELFAALPGGRFDGAHLSRSTSMHWVYAGIASVGFLLLILLFFEAERANPLHLLLVGLFTGTVGIIFLLAVQWCSQFRITRIRGRGIGILIMLTLAFIGWSYRSALDPDSNFFLSAIGFTFGVGLCEELTKAIPLLFFMKSESKLGWRGACLWGLASGIGFGVSEGVTYAADSYNGIGGVDIYLVRFISCVALHAMWAATVAIAIARNLEWYESVGEWPDFAVFTIRVLAVPAVLHGFYDTLLKQNMNVWALVVAVMSFAWLAIQIERARGAPPDPGPGRVRRAAW